MERAFLKPAPDDRASTSRRPDPSIDELEAARLSDDQERLVGLSLAPLAGLIAIVVTAHQRANNPPAYLPNGRVNPHHVSTALTNELELVLLALALAILVTSLLRRRLFTGIATALYGLAIFNLHWWGFGIPFVFAGAWFIVRAYRANQALKAATTAPGWQGGEASPRASKRYTPPAARGRRVPPPSRSKRERNTG
jgi:hypothetical protein